MTVSCVCGKFHYNLDSYFKIHGDYLGKVPEHRCQVPFLPNGKLFDIRKLKDNEPYPVLTYKWVCRHCGNFNTTDEPKSHKSNCEFVKHLAFRETEPFKKGVVSVKIGTSEKPKKPKPHEEVIKHFLTYKEIQTINNIKIELLNIIVKVSNTILSNSIPTNEIKNYINNNKDKKNGWFWNEWNNFTTDNKVYGILSTDGEVLVSFQTFRKYIWLVNHWEEMEAGQETFTPEKKRKIEDWYLLGKLSWNWYDKLKELKRPDGKPRLDPDKKYLLSELLLLIPKKKKPKPRPQNAPLVNQIDRFAKEYHERLIKYIDLEIPNWYPENEVDRTGKQDKYWKETGWRDFLESAKDTQNQEGVYIDLQKRINTLRTVFAKVVIERLIEKRKKHELESFMANYTDQAEKDIYEQEPYKTQIENIIDEIDVDPDISGLWDYPQYYDELYSNHERDAEEWEFKSLTAEQLNNLDAESGLKKGIFELRNFSELKKLKIKSLRLYVGATPLKRVDISATADNLEELDLSQCENLEDLILGKKLKLKKIDIRWTSLKKLNLKNTKIKPQDYDTLNFPIRMKSGATEPPARQKGETAEQYNERLYKTGEIIWPFEHFTGDNNLITLPKANITFNEPWIRYGKDWSNIDIEFKKYSEYIQEWYDNKFDYETAKDWISIFNPSNKDRIKKAGFCAWCRDVKKKNAEWVLNHDKQDGVDLEKEYKEKSGQN